jgi:hypothetical protein
MQIDVQTPATLGPIDTAIAAPIAALAGDSSAGKTLIYHQAPTFSEYLELNSQHRALLEARLNEIRIAPDSQHFFVTYPDTIRWLAVAADDSPGTAAVLPVLAHVAAMSPRLDLRVLGEEEAAAVLARLTGNPDATALLADSDLPLLFAFDEDWQLQDQWGPHPAALDPYLERWLAEYPEVEAESEWGEELLAQLTQAMRLWYNSGLNQACAAELCTFLAGMQTTGGDEDAA